MAPGVLTFVGATILALRLALVHEQGSAWAQDAPPAQSSSPAIVSTTPSKHVPSPSAAEVLRGLRAGAEQLPQATRVQVLLLEGGRLLGRGSADQGADVAQTALRSARADAMQRLAGAGTGAGDALQQQAAQRRVDEALLSVEVAEAAVPLIAQTFAQADWDVRPGLEGIRVVGPAGNDGVRRSALVYPSQAWTRASSRGTGQTPAQALLGAISEVSGDPTLAMAGVPGKEMGDLARAGWTFERFAVSHAVELSRGGPPLTLTRGVALVPLSSITRASLIAWRERLIEHIVGRVLIEVGSESVELIASYSPTLGEASGAGGSVETLLAAYALGPHEEAWATRIVANELGRARAEQQQSHDLVRDAALLLAWARLSEAQRGALASSHGETLLARQQVLGEAWDATRGWATDVPDGARGLVALALVRDARTRGDGAQLARGEGATRDLLASGPPGSLVTHVPWLAWAAIELDDAKATIGAGPVLLEMRSLLGQRQVSGEVARGEGMDLEGAIIFGQGAQARRALGWQTARPLAGLATMLGDARLTPPNEQPRELLGVLASLRFLRQLTLDESAGWLLPDPKRTKWGVRNAPWDQRQSIEASVMTLLALDEAIKSIDRLAGAASPAPAAPSTPAASVMPMPARR